MGHGHITNRRFVARARRGLASLTPWRGARSVEDSDRTGRVGVMYVRSLLAQAGVANAEFSPGEDHLAADANVDFPMGPVRVQIKAGRKRLNKDGSITVPVTESWKAKWAVPVIPVYLIYVRLGKEEPAAWIEHESDRTVVHATALWTRVNAVKGRSVRLPAQNRLTAATFEGWADEFARETEKWGKAGT
ncbi:MAG: DUF4365 domain-containing protein [Gordonia amarae]